MLAQHIATPTAERVLPRHHLLPASRPASVYRGVFDHIYIACPPDSRNPFAWLPPKNIFDGLDYGTLAAIEQSLQKRPRGVVLCHRRGAEGTEASDARQEMCQHACTAARLGTTCCPPRHRQH